jgi:MoaA/NifB/PqqE/SkfB family radical SAM enzyme
MCDMPGRASAHIKAGEQEFSTARFFEVIQEFAELGIPGIGFTGGEPLLRKDIFELLAETRRLGMIAHLNSNGWLLGDQEAERIIDIGVESVNISLDGATAATHDRIRNCNGSYEHAIAAIKRLMAQKQKTGSSIRIKTVAVLNEANIDEIPQLLSLGKTLGVDCIELIPCQPFAESISLSPDKHDQTLLAKIDSLVETLLQDEHQTLPVENSPRHLKLFHSSFSRVPSPVNCKAGYNSLAVDCYGNVFPCVPWINWGKTTGNINDKTLITLWNSPEYQRQRELTGQCHDCYLNCQTELNLLFS